MTILAQDIIPLSPPPDFWKNALENGGFSLVLSLLIVIAFAMVIRYTHALAINALNNRVDENNKAHLEHISTLRKQITDNEEELREIKNVFNAIQKENTDYIREMQIKTLQALNDITKSFNAIESNSQKRFTFVESQNNKILEHFTLLINKQS